MRQFLIETLKIIVIVIISSIWITYVFHKHIEYHKEQYDLHISDADNLTAKIDGSLSDTSATIAGVYSTTRLCAEYKKWQFYMLVDGHSVSEYTTSLDKVCYKSVN